MSVKFTFELAGSGWITAHISDEFQQVTFWGSYLSDAVSHLASATLNILKGSRDRRFDWDDEPGGCIWTLIGSENELRIEIHGDSKDGEINFSGVTTVKEFAGQVVLSLENILSKYGENNYEKEWGFGFPMRQYRQIRELLNLPKLQKEIQWEQSSFRERNMRLIIWILVAGIPPLVLIITDFFLGYGENYYRIKSYLRGCFGIWIPIMYGLSAWFFTRKKSGISIGIAVIITIFLVFGAIYFQLH